VFFPVRIFPVGTDWPARQRLARAALDRDSPVSRPPCIGQAPAGIVYCLYTDPNHERSSHPANLFMILQCLRACGQCVASVFIREQDLPVVRVGDNGEIAVESASTTTLVPP
jgi:hypothetical protein